MHRHSLTMLTRRLGRLLVGLLLLSNVTAIADAQNERDQPTQRKGALEVRVGGYQFAPFVEIAPDGSAKGLTLELIDAFNAAQDDYRFVFVPTKPAQRYNEFDAGRFDMLLFENKAWGWQAYPIVSSAPYLSGGERYIAKSLPNRDQSFFDNLADKRLVGIRGYHYRFANFNANPEYLHEAFTIDLIDSNAGSIRMVLSGRSDIAVVTQSFLHQQLKHNPGLKSQLLISEEYDQRYQHSALIRFGIKPTPTEIDVLIEQLTDRGVLHKLWHKYGLLHTRPGEAPQDKLSERDNRQGDSP